jgi:hypothetical protein
MPVFAFVAYGQTSPFPIPPRSRVFIDPVDGFGSELLEAFIHDRVPLVIVSDKRNADFEILGVDRDAKESRLKKPINWDEGGDERRAEAAPRPSFVTVKIVNLKTGDLVWGYGVSGTTDLRAAVESSAKQLKRDMKRSR